MWPPRGLEVLDNKHIVTECNVPDERRPNNPLMLLGEIMPLNCKNDTKHVNTLGGQNAGCFLLLNVSIHSGADPSSSAV
jgi:hypothetical protein